MRPPKRVDKYLRECSDWSLTELRRACAEGRVGIGGTDGVPGRRAACDDLVFDEEYVTLDNVALLKRKACDYLAFHKPLRVTSTTRDPDGQEDLSAWLSGMPKGVFPVGRLDRMTSGLLLCTNDGDFAHAILHPLHQVEKRYWLWLDQCLDDDDPRLSELVRGVLVHDDATMLRATSVSVSDRTLCHTELVLCLREGKHRQIRQMCRALNLRLVGLHRRAIGALELDGLAAGAYRQLQAQEVAGLWASAGGRAWVEQRQLAALRKRAQVARDNGQPLTRLEQWLETQSRCTAPP
jgi:23S rRNA pseudouridine2605 synthase